MDINNIISLYEEGKSLTFIANKYNTYGARIKEILSENNIKIRTHVEQNRISNQERGKKVNHQYFDNIDTPQKAWILGFIAADGSISRDVNRIKIGLSSIDREILDKIKKEMQIEKEVLDYESNQGFCISELSWSSENQKRKLAKYNIIPNKTYHAIHLPNFCNDYKMAYFLGFFDGDGCFTPKDQYCCMRICSYRTEILQDFAEWIKQVFSFEGHIEQLDRNRQNCHYLTYSTNSTLCILNNIYSYMISNECFFLNRKYQKYCNWKRLNNRI